MMLAVPQRRKAPRLPGFSFRASNLAALIAELQHVCTACDKAT
jgi:hypothetical protein